MALSPREADNLQHDEAAKAASCEKNIDEALKKSYIPGNAVSVTIGTTSKRILEEIARRYRSVGWTVTYSSHSDQRDGDYAIMVFKSSVGRNSQNNFGDPYWDR